MGGEERFFKKKSTFKTLLVASLAASRLELFAADIAAGGADKRALVEPPVGHEADGDLLLREEARVRVVQHHDVEPPVPALVLVATAKEDSV